MKAGMKPVQYFALIIGILYLVIGIAGVIPSLVSAPKVSAEAVNLGFTIGYGDLLGMFPINFLHNLVHGLLGFLGIFCAATFASSRLYSGFIGIFYGVLTIFGLFPATQSMLGFVPIFGNNIWLHAITSVLGIYFGLIAMPSLAQIWEKNIGEQAPSAK